MASWSPFSLNAYLALKFRSKTSIFLEISNPAAKSSEPCKLMAYSVSRFDLKLINCWDVTSEHTLYDDLAFYINRNDKEKNIRVVLILNQLLISGIKKFI